MSKKFLNDNISKQAKNQLADIDDQDDKMFNSLLKNTRKFQKENKTLKEQNKKLRIELKSLQILLKNAQKDVERLKEKYKSLNGINKSFSDSLKNSITYYKLNRSDQCKETLNHINLVEERTLIESAHRIKGLLNLNNRN